MCAQPNQRFTFVSFTNPEEAKKTENKKRIRSAAAFSGWNQRSDRLPNLEGDRAVKLEHAEAETSQPDLGHEETSSTLPNRPAPATPSNRYNAKRALEGIQPGTRSATDNLTHQYLQNYEHFFGQAPFPQYQASQWPHPQHNGCVECARRGVVGPCQCSKIEFIPTNTSHGDYRVSKLGKKRTFAQNDIIAARLAPLMETLARPQTPERMSGGKFDPFNSYPVPAEPWYDWVLHHMTTVFAPRGWPTLGITNAQGMDWERFMTRQALQEPALFYVRLLFGTGDLVALHLMRPEVSLWLRTQAVQAINLALNDPVRAVSDALILAVGRIALHESLYGDRIAANAIHRPAQFRMIMMRGGMDALPFPELVKRLMRWADRVMSASSGSPRYLVEEDGVNWTMTQSVDVLEKWVPHEGIALRQKVQLGKKAPSQGWPEDRNPNDEMP